MDAAESYQAFVSLTNRFGGTKKPAGVEAPAHQGKSMPKPKRRFDPRANAPPLVPLVEEGDQIQDTLFKESAVTNLQQHSELGKLSPVKGKWKHSTSLKSNHLNAPDFDALETASTASYSSAYSSKSESLSPTVGSVTELSDAGSIDSFLEYDISIRKESIPSDLKATFERPRSANGRIQYADVPDDYVHGCTKAWNKAIGRWVFEGIPQTYSPSTMRTRRLSNEVRVPTPLSTPLGSLENLAASGSRTSLQGGGSSTSLQNGGSCTSLLSSNFDDSEEDCAWNPDAKYKLGKFCHERRKSPAIAHTSFKMNTSSSCSELDSRLALLDERGGEDASKAAADLENKSRSTRKDPAEAQHVQISSVDDSSQTSLSSNKTDESEKQVTWNSMGSFKYGKFCSDCPSSHSSASTSHEMGSKMSSKSRDVSAPSRIKALRRSLSETQMSNKATETEQEADGGPRCRRPSSSTKWVEAHHKYSTLREHAQSQDSKLENDDTVKQSAEEPAYSSVVEQRAKLFGGTKRGGLRRTKSLRIGARKSIDKRT